MHSGTPSPWDGWMKNKHEGDTLTVPSPGMWGTNNDTNRQLKREDTRLTNVSWFY